MLSHNTRWDPPAKNPSTVEGYRVFWHDLEPVTDNLSNVINGLATSRLDAKETSIKLEGLKPHVMYELVIKAGNHLGASVLSEPLRFTLGDQHITSASHGTNAGVVSGIVAGLLAIVLAIAALFVVKRGKFGPKQANGGVAFENPSYLREMNVEHVQVSRCRCRVNLNKTLLITLCHVFPLKDSSRVRAGRRQWGRLAAGIAARGSERYRHDRAEPRQRGRPDGDRGEPVAVRGAEARPRSGRVQAAGVIGNDADGRPGGGGTGRRAQHGTCTYRWTVLDVIPSGREGRYLYFVLTLDL